MGLIDKPLTICSIFISADKIECTPLVCNFILVCGPLRKEGPRKRPKIFRELFSVMKYSTFYATKRSSDPCVTYSTSFLLKNLFANCCAFL